MRTTTLLSCSAVLLGCLMPAFLHAEDKSTSSAMDTLKKLVGTWKSDAKDPKGDKDSTLVFKVTSGETVVMETMFPGSDHEMVNMYHQDGDHVVMTHYCAMGNQPTMQLKENDNGKLVFEFIAGGNLKSREEPHMDALTITIEGDKLTEDWGFYKDGKIDSHEQFHFTRQQEK